MGQNSAKTGDQPSNNGSGGKTDSPDTATMSQTQAQTPNQNSSQGNSGTVNVTTAERDRELLDAVAGQTNTKEDDILQNESDTASESKSDADEDSDEGYIKFDDEEDQWQRTMERDESAPTVAMTLASETMELDTELAIQYPTPWFHWLES